MRNPRLSRRCFLAITGAALAAPRVTFSAPKVPTLLDHILLGCNELDRGVDFVCQNTGVRPVFGGVHPGAGTRNALLSLGTQRYLEVIAPDPAQPDAPDLRGLKKLGEPRLVMWAAHPGDVDALAARLKSHGLAVDGPNPGSRKRPDGRILTWKTLALKDEPSGLLPFFIEWGAGIVHPSVDARKGCDLLEFRILTTQPEELAKTVRLLELDVAVERAEKPQLRARITGPKGYLDLTS